MNRLRMYFQITSLCGVGIRCFSFFMGMGKKRIWKYLGLLQQKKMKILCGFLFSAEFGIISIENLRREKWRIKHYTGSFARAGLRI